MRKRVSLVDISLLFLLVLTLVLRTSNLSYNSLFLDEAIYIRLGQEFFSGTLSHAGAYSWVGGMPVIYPPISAIGYFLGGIIGTRLINVVLGTLSVYLVFLFIKQCNFFADPIDNVKAGIFGALLFTISPLTIYLSRIAIYDMLSFTFFLTGLLLLQKAFFAERNNSKYIWAVITLLLSFLTKYTTLMFFPFLSLIVLYSALKTDKKRIEEAVMFTVSLIVLIGYYVISHLSDLLQFTSSQVVNRGTTTFFGAAWIFLRMAGYMYIPGVIGLLFFLLLKKRQTLVLFLLSLVPIFVHILSKNTATLRQDAMFSLLFLAPLAGGLFVFLINKHRQLTYMILLLFVTIIVVMTEQQRYDFEHFWPNATNAMRFLNNHVGKSDKVLAEADDVAVIALEKKVPMEQVIGPNDFSYKKLDGNKAYQKAVNDKYFSYIELEENDNDFEKSIRDGIDNNYSLIYKHPPFEIYQVHK